MASIAKEQNGHRRILFVAPDGRRKTIRMGRVPLRVVEGVKFRVEELLASLNGGCAIETDTVRWVASLNPTMRDKLTRVGLLAVRKGVRTLGSHLDDYLTRRSDVKKSTLIHWQHTRRNLLAYFGEDRALATITAGEARDWERWLKSGTAREGRYAGREANEGLAPNTVRKRVSNAKQFLQDAVEHDLIEKNPFAKLVGTVGSNRERDFFIDRPTATKVLDACPDNQWRLLFALSRFGGLRCPSEHLALTWADVNWHDGKILVRSSKTEHHEGKATRIVPMFPELRPYLEQVWDEAVPGVDHIITRYRDANANLRTQLNRILRKAGVAPWPKLFHNLRASRATELAADYPAHVAAAWLGHSTLIANKHYWQVTDDNFTKAVGSSAAQNPAQQAHENSRLGSQAVSAPNPKTAVFPDNTVACDIMHKQRMGDTGLEPVNPHDVNVVL